MSGPAHEPLLRALAQRGGRVGLRRGHAALLDAGDPRAEARALAEGAGLVPRPGRTLVRATGADARPYLHRMLTQDVAGLGTDQGAAACLLNAEGRLLGRLLLWSEADALRLDFDPGAAATALPVLERYVIADDVTFGDETASFGRALLLGPEAPSALGALGAAWPEPGRLSRTPGGAPPITVLGVPFGARPAAELRWGVHDEAAALHALLARARLCGEEALDVARVAEGVPASGAELDGRILPNEALLDDAVSFRKGCYPGQEPVVMARHRGHPPTLLVRLSLEGVRLPAADEPLLHEGRVVGRVTTAVTALSGASEALGFVRHALARPGTRLSLGAGGAAEVR